MFRKKYAGRLEEEPVTVTIGENDEKFLLRSMDLLTRPKKKEIANVVSLMKTKSDWNNLVPFLAGLRMSNRILDSGRWQWLVRKAGEANALGIILQCAKQSERTGLRLNDVAVVQRLFFEIHRMAQKAEFKDPTVSKALSLARQFIELMETPEHVEHDVLRDPKRKPFVVGVLLELSAARALNEYESKDKTGDVVAYAQRLISTWELGNFKRQTKDWYEAENMLQENIPIYNALNLTMQVHGVEADKSLRDPLKTYLQQVSRQIGALTQKAPEKVKQKPTLGYQQSQFLFRK